MLRIVVAATLRRIVSKQVPPHRTILTVMEQLGQEQAQKLFTPVSCPTEYHEQLNSFLSCDTSIQRAEELGRSLSTPVEIASSMPARPGCFLSPLSRYHSPAPLAPRPNKRQQHFRPTLLRQRLRCPEDPRLYSSGRRGRTLSRCPGRRFRSDYRRGWLSCPLGPEALGGSQEERRVCRKQA